MQTQEEQIKKRKDENACTGEVVVRWERFLPRMALRVLLVEADDSTRQIIAALLCKCSYKGTFFFFFIFISFFLSFFQIIFL